MAKDAWYLECSYALWRVAHSAEGKRAGAGVAFNGLTDEMILHIIESKPGAKEDGEVEVVVVGLQYNLEVPIQLHRWAGEIEVVEAKIKGEPRNAVLPVDTSGFRYTGGWAPVLSMVGTISSRGKAGWAETGLYEARFRMINETSAIARLVPLP